MQITERGVAVGKECQIHSIRQMGSAGCREFILHFWNRLKRILKRRWRYLINLLTEIVQSNNSANLEITQKKSVATLIQPGDLVEVRSKEKIRATLNRWNQLKGCAFMEEMWVYCGTKQRVLKPVERFLDERDYSLKKCKGIVILDGVFCKGTVDFGNCDRMCYIFWREEWLKKI